MPKTKRIFWVAVLTVLALLVGGIFTYAVFPRIETKTVTKTIEVPGNCQVCPICKTCEVCKTKTQICDKKTCAEILSTTPNEQMVIDNKLTAEQTKHSSVQTVYMTCDSWKAREKENGDLVKDCWKGKRTIIELEPRRNNNKTCAILSVSGC